MSTTIQRTPKSGRQSLFFHDLAAPVSSRKSGWKFAIPGQDAAVSGLWQENFVNSDLPPPPMFTLEDRADFSAESGIPDNSVSPEVRSDMRIPLHSFGGEFSTPKSKSEASTSYATTKGKQQQQQQQSQQSPVASLSWWSPMKGCGSTEQEDNGRGSPVEGVVQPGALITVPPPREVARPEMKKNSIPIGNIDEEEYGRCKLEMSTTIQRTPKSRRQSLFFHDLAAPVSSRKSGGKFAIPGQAAAVSALWRENFVNSDLPPPPMFTLEDWLDFSAESGIPDYSVSPEVRSDLRTPLHSFVGEFSTPKSKSEASTSYATTKGKQQQQQQSPVAGLSWWSPMKGCGSTEQEDSGRGSSVGVVQPGALITVPAPREVARPEMKKNSIPIGNLDEEEWVTVYGRCKLEMSTAIQRTPKSGRQSLLFHDLATPVSSRKSGEKFSIPGQAAAVSALWRENIVNSDLPPPPMFTLEDRSDFSAESGILDY